MSEKKHKEMVIWAVERARLGQGDWDRSQRQPPGIPGLGKPPTNNFTLLGSSFPRAVFPFRVRRLGGTEIFLGSSSGQKRAWAWLRHTNEGRTAAGGVRVDCLVAPISEELYRETPLEGVIYPVGAHNMNKGIPWSGWRQWCPIWIVSGPLSVWTWAACPEPRGRLCHRGWVLSN